MNAIQQTIKERIEEGGCGKVYTAKDFLDIGSRDAVDQALGRLARAGIVQRLGRGLYYYPRMNARLGIVLGAEDSEIAGALARQVGARIVPSGAVAANLLGLSTQVPARWVYLTDGRSRQVRVGDRTFEFRKTAPKDLPAGEQNVALVVQALRYVGREGVDASAMKRLRMVLAREDRRALLREARSATDWVVEVLRELAVDEPEEYDRG